MFSMLVNICSLFIYSLRSCDERGACENLFSQCPNVVTIL